MSVCGDGSSVADVHPIEHLRYVARARGADPSSLVRETAHAISSMRFDPSGLVVACRRIVERHPDCGPLWWFCAGLVTAPDPFEAAWRLADEIEADHTPAELAHALPDDATVVVIGFPEVAGQALARRGDLNVLVVDSCHEASGLVQRLERRGVPCEVVRAESVARAVEAADVVLVEALAVSPQRVVATSGSAAAAMVGARLGVPVWLAAGVGRRLPDDIVAAIDERLSMGRDLWEIDHDVFPAHLVDQVAGPNGVAASSPAAFTPDCAPAPELLRKSPM
jgi:hypothetical protein